jgi:hypothetical protein
MQLKTQKFKHVCCIYEFDGGAMSLVRTMYIIGSLEQAIYGLIFNPINLS